jgi:hypothetical protein
MKGGERLGFTRHVKNAQKYWFKNFSEVTTVDVRNGWIDFIKMVFREFCMWMLLKCQVHDR